jgi:poly(3-hydroxybutyrate) depolymerase
MNYRTKALISFWLQGRRKQTHHDRVRLHHMKTRLLLTLCLLSCLVLVALRAQQTKRIPSETGLRLSAGDHERNVQVGDTVRRYSIHIPMKYRDGTPTPVVIAFHGGGGNPASMIKLSGLNAMGGKGVTDFRSVEHTMQSWIKVNGCDPMPKIELLPDKAADGMKSTRKTWSGGKNGSEVVLIEIENGGHTWPGMKPIVALLGESTMDISANDLMWDFFQKHPLRRD